MARRVLVVTFPYWPLLAAEVDPRLPAAVVEANRVTVCSPAAAGEGIGIGMRRREAESRCPSLVLVPPDTSRDSREFEKVLTALESVTPAVEVLHPGTCLFVLDSCLRFFGSEQVVVELAWSEVSRTADGGGFGLGVAEGMFPAELAALQSYRLGEPVIIDQGDTGSFLAPLHIGVLDRPDLCDLLVRLGINTLGDFAALPVGDVTARFGPDGLVAHRLASGIDDHLFSPRIHRPMMEVGETLDPPTDRIDVAIFIGKGLADRLALKLDEEGLICEKLMIQALFENGELSRSWRLEGASSAGSIAERVRWQLEGWMANASGGRSGELTALRLVPEELSADRGKQLSFWGGPSEAGKRAVRGVARLQGLLGPQAVLVSELNGGRGPADQFRWISADGVDLLSRSPNPLRSDAPWPGTIPAPSPALVFSDRPPVRLVGASDRPLEVVDRHLSGEVARLLVKGSEWVEVTGWSGPWPVKERWWDKTAGRELARVQVICSDDSAYLIAYEQGSWWLEAKYD
jgi:protein ImuB